MIPDHYDLIHIDEWCGKIPPDHFSYINTDQYYLENTLQMSKPAQEGGRILKLIATLWIFTHWIVSISENISC